jgi:hypothetical protein
VSDNFVLWIFMAAGVLAMVGFFVDELTAVLHKIPRLIDAGRAVWRALRGRADSK